MKRSWTIADKMAVTRILEDILNHMEPDEDGEWYHDDGYLPILTMDKEDYQRLQELIKE